MQLDAVLYLSKDAEGVNIHPRARKWKSGLPRASFVSRHFIGLAVTQRLDHAVVDGVCNRCANYTGAFHPLSYRMHRMYLCESRVTPLRRCMCVTICVWMETFFSFLFFVTVRWYRMKKQQTYFRKKRLPNKKVKIISIWRLIINRIYIIFFMNSVDMTLNWYHFDFLIVFELTKK